MSIPVVATPQAFEGIEALPNRDIILGEHAGEIAQAIIRLIKDVSLRKALGDRARLTIKKNYYWGNNLQKLHILLSKCDD